MGRAPTHRGGVVAHLALVLPALRVHTRAERCIVGRPPGGSPRPARDLARVARVGQRVCVVHLNPSLRHRALARDLVLARVARAAGAAVVLQVHGFDHELADRLESSRAGRLVRAGLRAADAVCAVDSVAAARLSALGARAPRVLGTAFDAELLEGLHGEGRRHVLFMGRLTPGKGARVSLEAWALIADRHPVDLVVAGEGPLEPDLRARAAELGLEGRVHLPGWVEGAAKRALLADAAALTLPSRSEGRPLVVLEAMAAGVPVIATPVGGVPETLAGCGSLTPRTAADVARSLDAVLDAPSGERIAAARARAWAEFTPAAAAAALLDVYRAACQGRRVPWRP